MKEQFGKWKIEKGINFGNRPGSHSETKFVKHVETKEQAVIKFPTDINKDEFRHEIQVLSEVEHPNIVTPIDAGESGGTQYLILPYPGDKSIRDEYTKWDLTRKMEVFEGMVRPINHLHRKGIVHGHPGLYNYFSDENDNPILYGFNNSLSEKNSNEHRLSYGFYGDILVLARSFYEMVGSYYGKEKEGKAAWTELKKVCFDAFEGERWEQLQAEQKKL